MQKILLRLVALMVAVQGLLALNVLAKSAMSMRMMRDISIIQIVRDDPAMLLIAIPALLLFAVAAWLWSVPSSLSKGMEIGFQPPEAFHIAIKLLGLYFLVPAVCDIFSGLLMFILLDAFKEPSPDLIALAYTGNAVMSHSILALVGGVMVFFTDRVYRLVSGTRA